MNNVRIISEQEFYEISYDVPISRQGDLDLYIEDCLGASKRAILWDCKEERTGNRIRGTVELYFDEYHVFDKEYVQEVSECMELLSKGKKLFYSIN